jgi:putative aldouronate transport system substrate-binding protein
MKRFLSVLFALSLALAASTALAGESYFGDHAVSDETIKLTAVYPGTDSALREDGDTLWFHQELEKATNVQVEYEVIKEADWATRTNLMFAAFDLPDVFLTAQMDVEEYGVSQEMLIPLDEYITPETMPNYYERLQMNSANASIPSSDGRSYFIGKLIAQNVNHEGNHYINKKWLDALGLPIPTTADELYATLVAFRDQDPNGNGEKDELPMSQSTLYHYINGVYPHFDMFGVPLTDLDVQNFGYVNIDSDNTVQFTAFMPGFRPAVEYFNRLYSEGLMDQESMTQDVSSWITKITDGRVGYFVYLRMLNAGFPPEVPADYVSLLPPSDPAYGAAVPSVLEVPSMGAVLTAANPYPEETCRWLDVQMDTRIMMIGYNGPDVEEGGPTLADGSPVAPTIAMDADGRYNILYVPEENGLYDYVPVLNAQFFAPGDYYFGVYNMPPHRVERFETSKAYADAGVLEPISHYYLYKLSKMDNESAVEVQRLYVEIQKFMREAVAGFITKGVTDDSFNQFLNQAKSVGAERYATLYQAAYDAYLAKQGE